jgi:hypothetical protein
LNVVAPARVDAPFLDKKPAVQADFRDFSVLAAVCRSSV